MIYKFIDNNGAEITVNSISSLQALVDSETIKENTKVKAGLRGKWTTAGKIEGLVFAKEEEIADDVSEEPKEDIKSFITSEETKEETIKEEPKPVKEELKKEEVQPWQNSKQEEISKSEPIEESKISEPADETETEVGNTLIDDTSNDDEWNEKQEDDQRDKTYDDENVIGLNFVDAVSTCFRKYFNFKDRASRSEYWYFQILFFPIAIWSQFPSNTDSVLILQLILLFGTLIPTFSSGVRRLHDRDKSGWWILISFIPFVGSIILIIILAEKGTEGPNRFGPYPLKLRKS
jgi:uncharacterized membrane protein YhaH (DUF805 family)